jgi:hypothetical protein
MARRLRNIIQIAVSAGNSEDPDVLYVLANDGTVWRKIISYAMRTEWEEINELPQPFKEES